MWEPKGLVVVVVHLVTKKKKKKKRRRIRSRCSSSSQAWRTTMVIYGQIIYWGDYRHWFVFQSIFRLSGGLRRKNSDYKVLLAADNQRNTRDKIEYVTFGVDWFIKRSGSDIFKQHLHGHSFPAKPKERIPSKGLPRFRDESWFHCSLIFGKWLIFTVVIQ